MTMWIFLLGTVGLVGRAAAADDACPGLSDANGKCVPTWCTSWFDGCNTCSATPGGPGMILVCTEMFCSTPEPAKCTAGSEPCPSELLDDLGNCVPEDCATWYDGCNSCSVEADKLSCTRKACAVADEGKCVESKVDTKDECPSGIFDSNTNCVPEDCAVWYDGCNSCSVEADKLACTLKACVVADEGKCLEDVKCPSGVLDAYKNCVDEGCELWFDGCNSCSVDEKSGKLGCTRKYCEDPDKAYCEDDEDEAKEGRPCGDDALWHKRNEPEKDCVFVKADAKKRCSLKAEGAVYAFEGCKETCGTCGAACVDDPDWYKDGEPDKDCAWVRTFKNRCASVGASGETGHEACRFACYTCDHF